MNTLPKPKLLAKGSATPTIHDQAVFMSALINAGIWNQLSAFDREAWIERAECYDTPGGRLIIEKFQLSHPFLKHDPNSVN